jgi:uncharacterized membrane protein
MSNRRPLVLLGSFAVVAILGLALAAGFDNNQGWNHPGQFVANIAWIGMLLAILGFVVTSAALIATRLRRHSQGIN